MDQLMPGVMWYLVFLFSVTVHEAAHARAAFELGDPTAYHGGQVTLDPWPHIRREPIGTIVAPILSLLVTGAPLGWASAPYDPDWADRHPRRAAWMAAAGPGANLLLAALAAGAISVGVRSGVFDAPESASMSLVATAAGDGLAYCCARTVSMLFSLNLLLGVFNLIPVPPLDGAGAAALFMSDETARRFQALVAQPGFATIGLLVAWKIADPLFDPIFTAALNLLYPGAHYG